MSVTDFGTPINDGDNGDGNSGAVERNSEQVERAKNPNSIVGKPITVNPADFGNLGAGGTGSSGDNSAGIASGGKRRRGRPPGSGKPRAKTQDKIDLTGLETVLYSAHGMLAAITKVEEFGISDDEAKRLAVGIANVGRHYDMKASEKTLDWINLTQCLAMVYGSRLMVLYAKARNNRTPTPQENVVPTMDEMPEYGFPPGAPVFQ